jgi:ubiquinone biosynthesis protein
VAVRGVQMAGASLGAGLVFAITLARTRELRVQHAAGRALTFFCTHLGATFIKIGQIASTRADLLPPGVVEELRALQDRVPPFEFDAVRNVVEESLGRPLDQVFSGFDPTPVAAASVAQVHRATLRGGGKDLAVKVRRPDVADRVALDRSILLVLARAAERLVPSLRLVSLEAAMRGFCDAVAEQLDLGLEAANNARFTANFADDPDVVFPTLHPEACSTAVLTMDFIHGVHEEELERAGVEAHRVVEAGLRAVCRMIFLHGFVHADLHPGNLRFLHPGRVVFLDLGLVGRMQERDRLITAQLLYAFATGQGATVARLFHENAAWSATPDYASYEKDIAEFVVRVSAEGLGNLQLTLEIGRLFDILRRHHIQAASHMTMVNLALATAEGLAKRLAPELSLTEAALPYLAEALGIAPPPTPSGPAPGDPAP